MYGVAASGLDLTHPLIDFVLDAINHRHKRAANGLTIALCSGRVRQTPVVFFDLTHPHWADLSGCTVTDGDHPIRFKALKIMP
jgi:hypothetical protein